MTVTILQGDVRARLAGLPSRSFDVVVTSPPYWGLRDYGVAGQLGLEPTLGEHIAALVEIFREVRRVLKSHGTVWLNYGDCYAAAPNGKSAAAYKADGSDDRTFRDKPFSTVGPINAGRTYYGSHGGSLGIDRDFHDYMRPKAGPILQPDTRGQQRDGAKEGYRPDSGFTVRPGGVLKPKDLCMIPNRLAIALQDDGWYVRSEIIWHKPNPMPESVYDRPTTAHEKIWLLTKSEDYFYNHEAIREPVTGGAHARATGPNSREKIDRVPISRKRAPGVNPKAASEGSNIKAKGSFLSSVTQTVETRNARNVWTIAPKAFRDAHFATFPPALVERCLKAGAPSTTCAACGATEACGGICEVFGRTPGRVLDPFGGAGTVGLVADQLGLDATLIELNPEYVSIMQRRLSGMSCEVVA